MRRQHCLYVTGFILLSYPCLAGLTCGGTDSECSSTIAEVPAGGFGMAVISCPGLTRDNVTAFELVGPTAGAEVLAQVYDDLGPLGDHEALARDAYRVLFRAPQQRGAVPLEFSIGFEGVRRTGKLELTVVAPRLAPELGIRVEPVQLPQGGAVLKVRLEADEGLRFAWVGPGLVPPASHPARDASGGAWDRSFERETMRAETYAAVVEGPDQTLGYVTLRPALDVELSANPGFTARPETEFCVDLTTVATRTVVLGAVAFGGAGDYRYSWTGLASEGTGPDHEKRFTPTRSGWAILRVTDAAGAEVTRRVLIDLGGPSVSLEANPGMVEVGQQTRLSATAEGADDGSRYTFRWWRGAPGTGDQLGETESNEFSPAALETTTIFGVELLREGEVVSADEVQVRVVARAARVTVRVDGPDGHITSNPAGLTVNPGQMSEVHMFEVGTEVALTAHELPDTHIRFLAWTGDCVASGQSSGNVITFQAMTDMTCTARYQSMMSNPCDGVTALPMPAVEVQERRGSSWVDVVQAAGGEYCISGSTARVQVSNAGAFPEGRTIEWWFTSDLTAPPAGSGNPMRVDSPPNGRQPVWLRVSACNLSQELPAPIRIDYTCL